MAELQGFNHQLLKNIECARDAKVKLRIMLDKDLLKASDEKGTLMHYAAEYNNPNIIRHLINVGLDINCLNSRGQTPLMIAVEQGSAKAVKTLIGANANIDITDPNGHTALKLLFSLEHVDEHMLEVFVKRFHFCGISTDGLVDRLFEAGCPMSYVAYVRETKRTAVMLGLLKRGIHVDSTSAHKPTAFQAAVRLRNLHLAKWLIDRGADVNAADEQGEYSIHDATTCSDVDLLSLLLEHGANPDVEDADGLTPLSYLIVNTSIHKKEMQRDNKCIELLLQHGAVIQSAIIKGHRIFDLILDAISSERTHLLVAHVAMLAKRGYSLPGDVLHCDKRENRNKVPRLKKDYENCKHILGSIVYDTLSLLDLLYEKERRMRMRVRNETFMLSIKPINRQLDSDFPFYCRLLNKRISEASNFVKLEEAAIQVLCKLFDCSFNKFYNCAREIVVYFNKKDLEKLCQV